MPKKFPFFNQLNQMDCGPTCLKMISKYYGKNFSIQRIRDISGINREGVSLLGISEAAEKLNFRTMGARLDISALAEADLPLILHWQKNHFVILYKIKKGIFYIADPAKGMITCSRNEVMKHWISSYNNGKAEGILLLLSPMPAFYSQEGDEQQVIRISYMFGYLSKYKGLVVQLLLGLAFGTLLQLIVPFLTQAVVDVGISTHNINFVYVVLMAQSMLFLSRVSVDFIRSWILLYISSRINISILTDFLIKLMKLPMSFFDTKMTGDIMQRMNDQKRIESFLTGSTLTIVFSFFNLIVFAIILAYYNVGIFLVFLISSILYTLWVVLFLNKRRQLDIKRFELSSKSQSSVVQLIGGMQEIKLNNCERQKRWEWERVQAGLFRFGVKSLSVGQFQQAGAFFINEGKNILITFLVAKLVIDGNLTLGAMMAVQYIIGQLNSPIEQLLNFIQQMQDAKISMERLDEIHQMEDEEPANKSLIQEIPSNKSLSIRRLQFTYPGAGNEPVLKDIDLEIPEGKTTAIVGTSGSGKTTILKLLLRFYTPQKGEIKVGPSNLEHISHRTWRSKCGVVMQDGFIFSDTIANNIAVGDPYPDPYRLQQAIVIANIQDLIDALPLGINTKIGAEGNGISQGQKQRILIARTVYKDPEYIFFDEATNALDANNEQIILENMEDFFKGRTVVVVAHRLSTVKNADNIIVLEKGKIVEQGTHYELSMQRGNYYQLVKNQLELGV